MGQRHETSGRAWNRATPIVALDVGSLKEARAMAQRVSSRCRFFKVGSELFTATGPAVVSVLQEEFGADVFLDLKFNDIPNTVAGAVRSAAALGVRLITVHASGGRGMLQAAQSAWTDIHGSEASPARFARGGLLAVTVLTSFEASSLGEAWGRQDVVVEREVLRLAGEAAAAGLHGIVCSGFEAAGVRAMFGDRLALLIPGIRLAGGQPHDQQRVIGAGAAQELGARYLVLGRAVTSAKDPASALAQIMDELGGESEPV